MKIVQVEKSKEHYFRYGYWVSHLNLTYGGYIWLLSKSNRKIRDMELIKVRELSQAFVWGLAKEHNFTPEQATIERFDGKVFMLIKEKK